MILYPYGYCGMPCALCTRYRTEGKSKCAGCSSGGYYTEPCKAHHCCVEKGLKQCGECEGYPCARLGKMSDFSDLNTNNVKQRTCDYIAAHGFDAWHAEYARRADMLTEALSKYNNGRMKRYICELFIQYDMRTLQSIMRRAEGISGDANQRGKAFRDIAEQMKSTAFRQKSRPNGA